jgi:hypothetical protein
MKEADVVAKIHDELKKQLPRAVYLKLNDMSTTGIPDLALTYGGRTLFVEVKYLRADEARPGLKKHFSPLQLATCRLLEQQGRCQYFIACDDAMGRWGLIIRPHQVAYALEKGAARPRDLWNVAGHRAPLDQAIDHLVWMTRQP